MSQSMPVKARLYHFLLEVYGDQSAATRVEVDVEALSGGAHGRPHLEVTEVRVYAEDIQLLPDFEDVAYWKEMLAASPNLFQDCTTHQDRLDTVKAILERERLYLEYGLGWPDANEKVISPLRFTIEELRQMASADTPNPPVFQIHDPLRPERTIRLILRQYPGHLMLEAYPRLKATDEPWFDAIGAVAIEIYDNKLQVQLYDQVGIEKDMVHWQLPDAIGEGSFVLAENIDGSNPRTWLDHPVYHMYRNASRYWEAAILLPTSQTPVILNGEETSTATVKQVKARYGESAERWSEVKFQEEIERRTTHTEEMLALLKDNWTGQDLSGWHVDLLRFWRGLKQGS